jgi:predicted transposase YbfD/YdcC
MPVKGNQPTLQADIECLLKAAGRRANPQARPVGLNRLGRQRVQVQGDTTGWPLLRLAQTCEVGHGRVEQRCLQVVTIAPTQAWLAWPGCRQVFCVQRTTRCKKRGHWRQETVYGITSLTPQQADAATLLAMVRAHWGIENGLHWVRHVTFDEDRSQVRTGHLPQVLAAVRNTAIGLLHQSGAKNIAAACRTCAAQPWQALHLLGIQRTE